MSVAKPLPEIQKCCDVEPWCRFVKRTVRPCGVRWQVVCRGCGRYGLIRRTERGAINAWNSLTREGKKMRWK